MSWCLFLVIFLEFLENGLGNFRTEYRILGNIINIINYPFKRYYFIEKYIEHGIVRVSNCWNFLGSFFKSEEYVFFTNKFSLHACWLKSLKLSLWVRLGNQVMGEETLGGWTTTWSIASRSTSSVEAVADGVWNVAGRTMPTSRVGSWYQTLVGTSIPTTTVEAYTDILV